MLIKPIQFLIPAPDRQNKMELTCEIIDIFEDLLDRNNCTLERTEDELPEDAAIIYGDTYYEIEDQILYLINSHLNINGDI